VTLAPPPKKYGGDALVDQAAGPAPGHREQDGGDRVAGVRGPARGRVETFKFSTDPELVGKVTDVVGLYLSPPENAIVLCVDWGSLHVVGEKSQIQALDRTAPMLPMQPGLTERRTHDYRRHGTSTLFAALEIATGKVTAACKHRHRHP
jgi:hypothetical protein